MQNIHNINSLTTNENTTKTEEIENKHSNIHDKESTKKNNICDICHKSFSTLGNMRNHKMTIHENYRPFECTFPGCNKKYSIENRYLVHMRTHLGVKPFICQICSKSFNEKGNLKTHLKFHSELRPFKCPFCIKTYKTKGHLKDHIEIQHNLVKKYECQHCGKKFGRISTLKSHIRTHNSQKRYKCKIDGCEKWFTEKGNMKIHYKRHLKKLNQIDENEKIEEKKYLEKKIIPKDLEDKIKEAIDNLKDNNNGINKTNKNLELNQVELKKQNKLTNNNTKLFSLNKYLINHNDEKYINLNSDNLQYQLPRKNSEIVEHKINSNINNVNNKAQIEDKINNNFRFFNENYSNTNFNNHINNVNDIRKITNLNNYSNYSNNEHIINNNKESQNNFGFLPIFPDFNQIGQVIDYENNIDLFKKLNDNSTCFTRPSSDFDLFMEKKPNDIFVKDIDLVSEEEFPKNSKCKYIIDNSNINEVLNKDFNSTIYAEQQGFFNEQAINKNNYKFNEMNGYKDIQKFQYFD